MNTIGMIIETLPLRAIDRASLYEVSYYAAMCGEQPGWPGGSLYEEMPRNSGKYREVYSTTSESQIGVAASVLSSVSDPSVWDRSSSVTIDFYTNTTLENATELQLTQSPELNCLAISNSVGVEVIQFRDAVESVPASGFQSRWTVSVLLRGRAGTDRDTGIHAVGDRVVLVDSSLRQINFSVSDIGA